MSQATADPFAISTSYEGTVRRNLGQLADVVEGILREAAEGDRRLAAERMAKLLYRLTDRFGVLAE